MQRPFVSLSVTRFVNRERVIELLRQCARQLVASIPDTRVYLFGSYATGQPTPRSDADVAVVIRGPLPSSPAYPAEVERLARDIFLQAPVPVDLFVFTEAEFREGEQTGKGVAGAAARHGIPL